MADTLAADVLDQLRGFVDREVRGGFTPVGEIPDAAVEYLGDEAEPAVLQPYAEQYTAEALVAHAEAEEGWVNRTDCDRLDAAFARLESSHITARQNFSCCQNCGHSEMRDLVQESLDTGRSVRGYTFYHQQDTDAAVDGEGLYLAWGTAEPGDGTLASIGKEVVAALRAEGLQVAWNGSTEKRIKVSMDWQRRRSQ